VELCNDRASLTLPISRFGVGDCSKHRPQDRKDLPRVALYGLVSDSPAERHLQFLSQPKQIFKAGFFRVKIEGQSQDRGVDRSRGEGYLFPVRWSQS